MKQNTAQIVVVLFQLASILSLMYYDVNGRQAKAASGFIGIVVTLVVSALATCLYSAAGLYSTF